MGISLIFLAPSHTATLIPQRKPKCGKVNYLYRHRWLIPSWARKQAGPLTSWNHHHLPCRLHRRVSAEQDAHLETPASENPGREEAAHVPKLWPGPSTGADPRPVPQAWGQAI